MLIFIDNRSLHGMTLNVCGKSVKMLPKQIISAEIGDDGRADIELCHEYKSHRDAGGTYVLVVDSRYVFENLVDGDTVSVAHTRIGFRLDGVYERFFAYCNSAALTYEYHTVTDSERLIADFKKRQKDEKKSDRFFFLFIEPLLDLGCGGIVVSIFLFIAAWVIWGLKKALLGSLLIIAVGFAFNLVLNLLVDGIMKMPEHRVKNLRRRRKKTDTLIDGNAIIAIEEFCTNEAVIYTFTDPDRNGYGNESVYEG